MQKKTKFDKIHFLAFKMQVILDHQQHPQGVFLPLTEWEQLKFSIDSASELYKLMDELS